MNLLFRFQKEIYLLRFSFYIKTTSCSSLGLQHTSMWGSPSHRYTFSTQLLQVPGRTAEAAKGFRGLA